MSSPATSSAGGPPIVWADVATKRDLDVLEQRIRSDLKADLHAALASTTTSQTRTQMFAVIGSNFTMATLAFAAASLR